MSKVENNEINNQSSIPQHPTISPSHQGQSGHPGSKSYRNNEQLSADHEEEKFEELVEEENQYGPEDEKIDYSDIFLRESKDFQEIMSRMNAVHINDNKVQNTYVPNVDIIEKNLDKKVQNRFVFDVLPSFEMYRSIQYSTPRLSHDDADLRDTPPDYFNYEGGSELSPTGTDTPLTSISSAPVSSAVGGHSHLLSSITRPSSSNPLLTTQEFERNMVDKSHTLRNINTPNIDISIHVTKDVPHANEEVELESILKEYTSGDIVHGYVIVENLTNYELQFDLFHLTLEGTTCIVDYENKKQSIKRFLSMIDMSASWSHGGISPSSNIAFEVLSTDHEGCILGFRNDRILSPRTKYKKFFTFKFPYKLLDTTCRHQQEVHTLLPPSLGVDTVKNFGKYSSIDVNPLLSYGHLGYRGSPIKTHDFSGDNLSISYGINAKVIGTYPKDPTRLCVLKHQEYALRFIPFGFGVPLFSSEEEIKSLYSNMEHSLEMAQHALRLNQEGNSKEVEAFEMELKNRQLSTLDYRPETTKKHSSNDYSSFPIRNEKFGKEDYYKVETVLNYIKDKEDKKSNFLNKLTKKSKSETSGNNGLGSGLLKISSKIPKDGLPYLSPSLLRKTNELNKLSEVGLQNYEGLSSSLSNNEKQKLSTLKIKLKFIPSDNYHGMIPPKIKTIKTSLVAWNITSSLAIPIKLSSNILTSKEDLNEIKSKSFKYFKQFKDLEEKFKLIDMDIDRYFDKFLLTDLESMTDLNIEPFQINPFKQSIINETEWVNNNNETSYEELIKIIELKLDYNEDISETLLPNFQTCLISRVYCIKIDFKFSNGQTEKLHIPVRIRKFDDF
ncbi:Ubiquitin ligase-binding protein [Wickerhamomyces ciferrii]|uniref:Ubiquitin ligase-binding protein n=1 Tax=Wickerhamomyces ciferrii (strain ATCC 14091 / BCRC 22168 / CBS 111 / JCM 3599 / NBRC 0793 / NRRL Y-1031 F-60-10) TaxID=1206466 RepID=K0KWI4_WICCF|nr:Ubiquitin ligase-binding protein [Wickerhamomyces ciferrii]CCH46352.1 Ubiquitin ligase-binding protein [Wickerhamomyces ciferrii]